MGKDISIAEIKISIKETDISILETIETVFSVMEIVTFIMKMKVRTVEIIQLNSIIEKLFQ